MTAAGVLGQACRRLLDRPEFRGEESELVDIVAQCGEPLRVAVTGDVSTGKSTLVNALLRQEAAEVRLAETTSRVTWYRHPSLPTPAPLGRGHHFQPLAFELADRIVLADTPGVNTVSGNQVVTENMLTGSTQAVGSSAVLLYLMTCGEISGGGRSRVEQFAAITAGDYGAGFNVVLVGAKADTVRADDPAEIEKNLLDEVALPGATAVAVGQRLAASTRCTTLTRRHLATVRAISDDARLSAALHSGWMVLRKEFSAAGRDGTEVDELAQLVGSTRSLSASLEAVRDGRIATPTELAACWDQQSQLPRLERRLAQLADDGDLLTVNAVIARLRQLATRLGTQRGQTIRETIADTRRHPAFVRMERTAAALVLESPSFHYASPDQRSAAVKLLREHPGEVDTAELIRRWSRLAQRPDLPVLARQTAELVADVARAQRAERTQENR